MAQDKGSSLKPPGQRDTLTARALRTMAAERRAAELECELCTAREGLAHRDNAILSLEKSLDLNAAESARLAEQIAESHSAAEKLRAQLELTRLALSAVQAERTEANEKRQTETAQLDARLEAAFARAASTENQLAEAQQNLLVLNFHNSAAEKRTESLENSLRAKERELAELRQSNASLTDDAAKLSDDKMKLSEDLAKLSNEMVKLADEINARETALAHAEDRINLLAKLFMQLEAKAHHSGQKTIAGIAAAGNLQGSGRAAGQPSECAVLRRDLDSDAWLFGGGKPARLS